MRLRISKYRESCCNYPVMKCREQACLLPNFLILWSDIFTTKAKGISTVNGHEVPLTEFHPNNQRYSYGFKMSVGPFSYCSTCSTAFPTARKNRIVTDWCTKYLAQCSREITTEAAFHCRNLKLRPFEKNNLKTFRTFPGKEGHYKSPIAWHCSGFVDTSM